VGRIYPVSHVRRSLAALGLAAGLAVILAPVVAASTSVTYASAGAEYAATSTQGKFVGVAVATDDRGAWLAVVDHTVLTGGTATITGGTFSFDGRIRDVQGAFTGGSLAQTDGFTGCVKETFSVTGSLALSVPNGGTGSFTGTLTHFRTMFLGKCITYAATVKGLIGLTFP